MPGSSALIAGAAGSGKSTALAQSCGEVARRRRAVYASVEQSRAALMELWERLGIADRRGLVPVHVESLDEVLAVAQLRPALTIVDSSSKLAEVTHSSEVSIIGALHEAAADLGAVCIVSHTNAAGEVSGPAAKRHATDTVIIVEGSSDAIRRWRAPKNRHASGPGEASAVMRLGERGFEDEPAVAAPRRALGVGAALGLVEGKLYEVQALIGESTSTPRRIVTSGVSIERVRVILDVLAREGCPIGNDLTVRVYDGPAGDPGSTEAAIASALWSCAVGRALPPSTCLHGALGLDGCIRGGAVEVPAGYRLLGQPGAKLVAALDRAHLSRVV